MSVDIAISFDTTGSMYPVLHEVRRRVVEVVNELFNNIPDLRLSITAHGDYADTYDPMTLPLTNDKKAIINLINTVPQTSGHGNGGEAYGWVMHNVANLNWQADKRAYVLIGDENVHEFGKNLYGYGKVNHDWVAEQNKLKQLGVTTYVVRCLDRSDSRKFHAKVGEMNKTPVLALAQFNNIVEILTALSFYQVGNERVTEYADELKGAGKLNRNLANLIDSLLNEKTYSGFITSSNGLTPVSPSRFQTLFVDHNVPIKAFVEQNGARFRQGRGFYELTKREKVQENKEVILVEKLTGDMFSGDEARELINLPYGERGNLSPRDIPQEYTAFVQSTSNNRVLQGQTRFLYEVEHY